jgi:cysteine-rich repeat protein
MSRRASCTASLSLAALLLVLTSPAAAFTDLLAGKRASFFDKANPRQDSAKVTFSKESQIGILRSPLCPAVTKLRFVDSTKAHAEVTLPCAGWRAAGKGYRYSAAPGGPGGVRSIVYKPGTLVLRAQGSPYSDDPVGGLLSFVETRFTIQDSGGETPYCGRFTVISTAPGKVTAKGPTVACQEVCGNGVLEGAEQCDDGNNTPGDGCRANCTIETCGDGILDPGEQCDDHNHVNGDCCSSTCHFEPNGSACASDGNACTNDVCNGAGLCVHTPNSAPCDDHNSCTTNDTCTGGVCKGTLIAPWVNEYDYDDFTGLTDDRDEFIEIAGPAGKDLSGYQIISVEGNSDILGTPCFTGSGATTGNAHFIAHIPNGTVLHDDTGTGIGFFVACFSNTSTNIVAAGKCDVVLPAPATDSNLGNGSLLNSDESTCPDGVLVLDDDDNLIDAISWEGLIPAVGVYGPFFHVTPYIAERDEGFKAGVSIEKTTSTLARATQRSEWHDSGGCTDQGLFDLCTEHSSSPGAPNAGQTLSCGAYGSPSCAFLETPRSLLD